MLMKARSLFVIHVLWWKHSGGNYVHRTRTTCNECVHCIYKKAKIHLMGTKLQWVDASCLPCVFATHMHTHIPVLGPRTYIYKILSLFFWGWKAAGKERQPTSSDLFFSAIPDDAILSLLLWFPPLVLSRERGKTDKSYLFGSSLGRKTGEGGDATALPSGLGDHHLGPPFVELFPKLLGFQVDFRVIFHLFLRL